MKQEKAHKFDIGEDPAKLGGGCDIDGAYVFGVDLGEDFDEED